MQKNKKKKNCMGIKSYFFLAMLVVLLALAISYLKDAPSITGNIVQTLFQEDKNKAAQDRAEAFDALLKAETDMQQMIDSNLSTAFIDDALRVAKRHFVGNQIQSLWDDMEKEFNEEKRDYLQELIDFAKMLPQFEIEKINYSSVLQSTKTISQRKMQAYNLLDTISLTEDKITSYNKSKMGISNSLLLLDKAKKSFYEERYDEAASLMQEANAELEKSSTETKRIKEIARLGKNFFVRYWWQSLIVFAAIAMISIVLVKKIQVKRTKNKIKSLRNELDTLYNLIKKAQEDRFKNKVLTDNNYRTKITRYNERVAEIKHTIPVLESTLNEKKKAETKKEVIGILKIKK